MRRFCLFVGEEKVSFSWTIPPDIAWSQLAESYVDTIEAEIVALAEKLSAELEQWMKANHRWQSRTDAAEAALYSIVYHVAHESVTIVASHGSLIDYGWILELSGKGVIADAIDWFGPKLMQGVQEIVQRRGG